MTAKNLTQYQRDAVDCMRARLDPRSPAFCGSDAVRTFLLTGVIDARRSDCLHLYFADTLELLDVLDNAGTYGADRTTREYVASRARRARLLIREAAMKSETQS